MSDLLVKVCGLRAPEDALVAAEAGADIVGLVFAPSRRAVSLAGAARIVAALRDGGGPRPLVAGVFVDEPPDRLRAVVETLGLDLVQLSGDEPPEDLAALGRPAIKALRLGPDAGWDEARRLAERYLAAPAPAWALLVDAHVPGAYGGTGRRANWDLAARLAEEYPVILAGGLTPECVADAIEATRPLGVDVSSGVETDGVKDHEKIRAFVAAARAGRLVGAAEPGAR